MGALPFDPEDPPDDPPDRVRQPMLWRLAVRLYRDHDPRRAPDRPSTDGAPPAGPLRPVDRDRWINREQAPGPDRHRGTGPAGPADAAVRCPVCGHAWPCPARRTAERGLLASLSEPVRRRLRWFGPPNGAVDR